MPVLVHQWLHPHHAAAHSQLGSLVGAVLDSFREETAIDSINNRLSADLTTSKEPSIESLDGVFASLYTIKLEVDITLSVWIKCNVDNMTVFLLTFSFDIIFKLFNPSIAFLSVSLSAGVQQQVEGTHSAGLNMLRRSTQRLAWLTATGRGFASALG
jgi:hypothetical protein